MIDNLKLHGAAGTVLWGYRPAVEVGRWSITRDPKTRGWVLRGTPTRVDAFGARQRPLLFTATREKGFWAWGIESLEVSAKALVARLGPPER